MSVAAFFDIDGTLLPPPSLERRFLRYLCWRGELAPAQWARWLAVSFARAWQDPLAATHGNKLHYAGVRMTALQAWVAFHRRHPLPFFPAALERMVWHLAQCHRVFLVSGTLRPLAQAVAEALSAAGLPSHFGSPLVLDVVATHLEVRRGRFTGRVIGPAICGAGKARAVETLALDHGLDLAASFAYADRNLDRWMLTRVGHPAAVNPSLPLALLALRRGWPILHWKRPVDAHPNRRSYAPRVPVNSSAMPEIKP